MAGNKFAFPSKKHLPFLLLSAFLDARTKNSLANKLGFVA
jgi:hypothetical protein